MKTSKIKAFSLIELIVVSSILIIVSTSWVFYFVSFIDNLTFKETLSDVKNNFETLNNKISKKEIFDYEMNFSKSNLYYSSSENIVDLDTYIKIDSITDWVITTSFSGATSGTWTIKLYENGKYKKTETIEHDWTFTWSIINTSKYKITWSFSWNILNTINFNYFDSKKLIQLVEIQENSTEVNETKIKNILWKKEFWDDSSVEKIILTFEDNNWRVEILEIKK